MREKTVFSTNDVEKTEYLPAKELVQTFTLHYFPKTNSIWIRVLAVRPETIKLLEENTVEKLHDIGFGNYFLVGHQEYRNKVRQMKLYQILKHLYIKEIANRVKGNLQVGENICKSYI